MDPESIYRMLGRTVLGTVAAVSSRYQIVGQGKRLEKITTGRYDTPMHLRFLVLALGIAFVVPITTHAAIPFFGPIIPSGYNVCPASWGLLITVINNIISFLITMAIVFVAPLLIAYAGFLLVINPINGEEISHAKGILWHTILGIVIALAGYLIVSAIMAVLYNPKTVGKNWNDIIKGNVTDTCLPQAGALPGAGLNQNQLPVTGVSANNALNNPPSTQQAGSACDPAAVMAAAATGNYTLSTTQANIFACIAQPESSCGTNLQNYNWGNGSSAYGAFQVLLSTHAQCYEKAPCYAAAGVNGPLNCSAGFSGGNPKSDEASQAIVSACKKAASSLNCSATAAACLLAQNGGNFSAWEKDVNSQTQSGCITTGG